MFLSRVVIRNFRQFGNSGGGIDLTFNKGVTALIGPNDSGKTAIIDAIRYALLTRDQEYLRVQPTDFHSAGNGMLALDAFVSCTLSDLNDDEKGAFAEYLSYVNGEVHFVINWSAKRLGAAPGARRWVDVSVRSGIDGGGPALETSVRDLLASTYLKPLRDAERELSAGRGSRLSQVLSNFQGINDGETFDPETPPTDAEAVRRLSLLGLTDYASHHIKRHAGISAAETAINAQYLSKLALKGDSLHGRIDLTEGGTPEARLRQILERLELDLFDTSNASKEGRHGLGSNNLLYIACELLLLSREPEGLPLLLIEEPEAHLHPQRQLRLMEFLEHVAQGSEEAGSRAVQVNLSTHSPNLASKIEVANIQLLHNGRSYPLAKGHTQLDAGDYKYLQRFLDVTKSNLFFAQGVLIVEGDAEAILLPTIAKLMGIDLTEHGISIVNVGGTGLKRFSRIFQRTGEQPICLTIPVACITDMDVMPDCAPMILQLVEDASDPKWQSNRRRWKAMRDFGKGVKSQIDELNDRRALLQANDGQSVKTFVADYWTLEYDLARSGFAKDVYSAACLAANDDPLNEGKKNREEVLSNAVKEYEILERDKGGAIEELCTHVYEMFHSKRASKAIAAQYFAALLLRSAKKPDFTAASFKAKLPQYLVKAIEHVSFPEKPANAMGAHVNG